MATPMIRAAAASRVAGRVEPGVSGKEKQFQQSREFGPGPISPYPQPATSAQPRTNRAETSGEHRVGSGVYSGGAKTRPIPGVRSRSRAQLS
jgi:hypothetical protein